MSWMDQASMINHTMTAFPMMTPPSPHLPLTPTAPSPDSNNSNSNNSTIVADGFLLPRTIGNSLECSQIAAVSQVRSMAQESIGNGSSSFPITTTATAGVYMDTTNNFDQPLINSLSHSRMPYEHLHHHHHHNHHHYRHSYQPTTTFQDFESSQLLVMLNDQLNNHLTDRPIHFASTLVAAPNAPSFPTLRRSHSLEFISSAALHAPMADTTPCEGFHGATSFPGTPLSMDCSTMPADDEYLSEYRPWCSWTSPYAGTAGAQQISSRSSPDDHPDSPMTMLTSSFSTSLPSTYTSSSPSISSTCYSPSLSISSPVLDRKRILQDDNTSESNDETIHPSNSSNKKVHKQRYVCPVADCNRTFSRPYNLKSHGLTHAVHRPYACEKCLKTFARVHDRNRHMNSHMPQKPHVCIVCLGRFARQDAVIRHLKLSNELNACSRILKESGVSFRNAAAGRVARESLGEDTEIKQRLEVLEEEARKARAKRTLELMNVNVEFFGRTSAMATSDTAMQE